MPHRVCEDRVLAADTLMAVRKSEMKLPAPTQRCRYVLRGHFYRQLFVSDRKKASSRVLNAFSALLFFINQILCLHGFLEIGNLEFRVQSLLEPGFPRAFALFLETGKPTRILHYNS